MNNTKNLVPWEVNEEEFPEAGKIEERLIFLLRYAILAPSGHNTQPWYFSVRGNEILVYVNREGELPIVDPDNRELYISVGCALANLLIAGKHFQLGCKLELFPEGERSELVAVVEFFQGPDTPEFPDLFPGILLRHTNRREYAEGAIEEEKLQELKACVDEDGFRLDLILDRQTKSQIAELVCRGDLIQLRDKAFRRELASWIRPNWMKTGDGMPGYAFGVPDVMSFLGPFFMKTFNMSKSQAKKDMKLVEKAPAIGILSSAKDDKRSWVKTGVLFGKLANAAAVLGLQYSFFNQPIEVPELRKQLEVLLRQQLPPQLLFRFGYAKPGRHTPRKPIDEVLWNN